MNIRLVLNFLGKLFVIEAALMLPALGVSIAYGQGDAMAFVYAILTIVAVSAPLIAIFRSKDQQMYAREAMAVAGLGWLLMSLLGGLPLVYSGYCSFTDAFFEITSGFTTTGATIMTDIEALPNCIITADVDFSELPPITDDPFAGDDASSTPTDTDTPKATAPPKEEIED